MITDHRYDAGWPRDDSKGCLVLAGRQAWAGVPCRKPEVEHALSEYPSQLPARGDGAGHRAQVNPGDMHEPKPYTGELDWPDLVHPYTD